LGATLRAGAGIDNAHFKLKGQAADFAKRLGNKMNALPTRGAQLPLTIHRHGASETARRQQGIDQPLRGPKQA
jgi:hypothetical protein